MVSLNLELGVGKAIFSIFDLGSSYWIVLGMINLNDKIFYMRGVDVVYPSLELNPYVIGNFRKLEKTSFRKLGRLARQYLPGSIPSKGSVLAPLPPAPEVGSSSLLLRARVWCPGFCPTQSLLFCFWSFFHVAPSVEPRSCVPSFLNTFTN